MDPPLPPAQETDHFAHPERCYNKTRWFDPRYPFMAFSLTFQKWEWSIFDRLAGNWNSFPVIETQEGWCLEPYLQKRWWELELTLTSIYESVSSMTPFDVHTLDIQPYRRPITWGYSRKHKTEQAARSRIRNSRNAFVPLMALCTYAVAICERKWGTVPLWFKDLVEKDGVTPQWADEISRSEICRTDEPRIGAYIELATFTNTNLLRCYVAFGVPIWIKLPNKSDSTLNTAFIASSHLGLRVTHEDKLSVDRRNKFNTSSVSSFASFSLRKSFQQLPNEPYDLFFRRREDAKIRHITKECPTERTKRLDRERNSFAYECPTDEETEVFEWREIDGCLIRTHLELAEIERVWCTYASSQKRFNSVLDEWDLCKALDPGAQIVNIEETSVDDVIWETGEHLPVLTLRDLAQAALEETYATEFSVRSTFTPAFAALEETLYCRYGLQPDGGGYTAPTIVLNSVRVAKTLTEYDLHLESGTSETAVIHFISALIADHSQVPPPLYDLHETNTNFLKTNIAGAISFTKFMQGHYGILISGNLTILVPSPSFVVEAYRLCHSGFTINLALHFISRGTCFKLTTEYMEINPFLVVQGPRSGLGFRPHNYRPNRFDYQGYVTKRNTLFSDLAFARAALCRGGIVWRIAVDAIEEVHGPVDFSRLLEMDLEDVQISQTSIGIIVGLYQIWSENERVITEASWWPQPHQWLESNLDVGYWSKGCENWYQLRLKGILKSEFNIRSGGEWRKALSFYKSTSKLRTNNEVASEKFLKSIK